MQLSYYSINNRISIEANYANRGCAASLYIQMQWRNNMQMADSRYVHLFLSVRLWVIPILGFFPKLLAFSVWSWFFLESQWSLPGHKLRVFGLHKFFSTDLQLAVKLPFFFFSVHQACFHRLALATSCKNR